MAVLFDAVNDPLMRTTGLPGITLFTIMAWAYLAVNRAQYSIVLCYGNNSSTFYQYGMQGGSNLGSWNGTAEATGTTWTTGTWKHLAMILAGTGTNQFVCYQNGVADTTTNGNASMTGSGIRLGSSFSTSTEWFNGRIAAVKIYAAALSVTELQNEMRQMLPYRTANLNMFCPFLLATDTKDYSGAGTTWTSDGGALTTADGPPIPWSALPLRRRRGAVAAATVSPPHTTFIVSQAVQRAVQV